MASEVRKALGFMTGTSLDGIDMAVIETDGEGYLEFGPWAEMPMPADLRALLERTIEVALKWSKGDLEPPLFAEARRAIVDFHFLSASDFLVANGLQFSDMDVLGVHGQTVLHERPNNGAGRTVQLFDASYFARLTGCTVVSDFRSADVAAGGEGAPLAPVYHRALALNSGMQTPVSVVNLGGVANITVVSDEALIALDTGPANGLMDQWVRQHGRGDYDHEGKIAACGHVNAAALHAYMCHAYFTASAPKSLDRYDFNLQAISDLSLEDGMATLCAFTVESLKAGIKASGVSPKTIILSGGGRSNDFLVSQIRAALPHIDVKLAEDFGWRGGALEAEAFAYMAVRTLRGLPISFPKTTGVPQPMTGGVITRPA